MIVRKIMSRVTVLLTFLLSMPPAMSQNRNAAAFAVSYFSKTQDEARGVVMVIHAPEKWQAQSVANAKRAAFSAPAGSPGQTLSLQVYNLTGQQIYQAQSYRQELSWDGRDQGRHAVASGIYLFIIRNSNSPAQTKSLLSGRLFEDVTSASLPQDTSQSGDVELGDLDGDGDLDLVIAHLTGRYGRQPQVLINDGRGKFRDETATRLPHLLTLTNDVDLVDVDGDDDLDIYLANTHADWDSRFADKLLINDGNGRFRDETAARISQDWIGTPNVAFGDVDGDGDADLLVTHLPVSAPFSGVRLLLNNGQGVFADSTKGRLDTSAYSSLNVALFDANHDHRLDMALANHAIVITDENGNPIFSLSGQNAIFINQGRGYFKDETALRRAETVQDLTVELAPGDVDRDGDLDLFVSNVGFSAEQYLNRLLINNGQGYFADESAMRLPEEAVPWNNDADFADFNGDGALDLFMASVNPEAGGNSQDLLYVNDGAGRFSDLSTFDLPEVIDFSAAAASGDIDGDADADLLVANTIPALVAGANARNRLYQNQYDAVATKPDAPNSPPQLFENYPNPFRASTTIRFQLRAPSLVRLDIYNLGGQIVRTLAHESRARGEHRIVWDGFDDHNRLLPNGVYFYRLRTGAFRETRKLILLR
ncbi:FG-GAP-like repeat-containing protein [candidate division KSB1 bacterium]|nr:FG-GAP-like repeat-containing protein [candidate division KSB1 bacterium]